ncbi:MAG: DUF6144 family protein [Chloroflexota bacterium]
MDEIALREHLRKRGYREETLPAMTAAACGFARHLGRSGDPDAVRHATVADFEDYSRQLMQTGENTPVAYEAIAECALLEGNQQVYTAALETVDGWDVPQTLAERIEAASGVRARDEVFAGVPMPSIGLGKLDQATLMQTVISRMARTLPEHTCRSLLTELKHALPAMTAEDVADDRRLLAESADIDEFLSARHRGWLAKLEALKDRGEPLWTITIDDELLSYLRQNPEIGGGVRHGNRVYESKIPYVPQRYLHETDPVMKRYYFCHCPWAREAIRRQDLPQVPAMFCHCSLGYSKNYWDALFGCQVEGELVESVLNGDLRCRMSFTLPAQYQIPQYGA